MTLCVGLVRCGAFKLLPVSRLYLARTFCQLTQHLVMLAIFHDEQVEDGGFFFDIVIPF
jgi:hypothetical protein